MPYFTYQTHQEVLKSFLQQFDKIILSLGPLGSFSRTLNCVSWFSSASATSSGVIMWPNFGHMITNVGMIYGGASVIPVCLQRPSDVIGLVLSSNCALCPGRWPFPVNALMITNSWRVFTCYHVIKIPYSTLVLWWQQHLQHMQTSFTDEDHEMWLKAKRFHALIWTI